MIETAYAHSLAVDHLERIEVDFGSFRPAEDVRDILVSSVYILVARQSIYHIEKGEALFPINRSQGTKESEEPRYLNPLSYVSLPTIPADLKVP